MKVYGKLELGRMMCIVPYLGTTQHVGTSGGAWPFLVGGLPCQVDSGNERDLSLLNSHGWFSSRRTS